jgi:hypothetical protein
MDKWRAFLDASGTRPGVTMQTMPGPHDALFRNIKTCIAFIIAFPVVTAIVFISFIAMGVGDLWRKLIRLF